MTRRSTKTLSAALVLLACAPAAPAGAESPPAGRVCPLLTPAPPPVEGASARIVVGQHCGDAQGRAREEYAVTTDLGDGTVLDTPFDPFDGLWAVGP